MEDNKDFLNWYKTKITENLQDPPEDAWKNIADELDTNDVWERITVKLDDNSRWFTQKPLYYAVPLLLLLITGGLLFHFDKVKTISHPATEEIAGTEDKIISDSKEPKPESAAAQLPDVKSENTGDRKETPIIKKEVTPSPNIQDNATSEILQSADGITVEPKEKNTTDEPLITESDVKNPLVTSGKNSLPVSHLLLPDSMLRVRNVLITLHPDSIQNMSIWEKRGKLIHYKTIAFGITTSVKNTWLLNRTTFAGLEKHTLNTTLPDFGKDIGMVFCYSFSPKLSVQAEGMFISEMGQKYNEYRNGKYVNREIDLRYYTLNLLLKYSRNKMIHGQPLNAHGIIGGLYTRGLNNATQTINNQTISTRVTYSKYDYGIILGYEYNRYLFTNLVITSGLRVNYGFPDIDTNSWSKTATGSFDLNIAIKYRIDLD